MKISGPSITLEYSLGRAIALEYHVAVKHSMNDNILDNISDGASMAKLAREEIISKGLQVLINSIISRLFDGIPGRERS
jgi:hypothetical protein